MASDGRRARKPLPRGRKAEAAVNDVEIMVAAFNTLTSNPRASMAEIAACADVGVASLYRRYPTRQTLVHQLCLRAMDSIAAAADACVHRLDDQDAEPWPEFLAFLSSALADGAGAMRALAGTFHADAELARAAAQMNAEIGKVLALTQARGAVRADVTAADITQFFEMLRAIRIGDRRRSDHLRQRYLHLFAPALKTATAGDELPIPSPHWDEISTTWNYL